MAEEAAQPRPHDHGGSQLQPQDRTRAGGVRQADQQNIAPQGIFRPSFQIKKNN